MRKILMLMTAVMCLMACSSTESDMTVAKNGNVVINFNTTGATRAAGDVPFKQIDVLLLDGNGKVVQRATQSDDSYTFGVMSLELPIGSYRLIAVGHSRPSATLSSEVVTFAGGVGDTFYHDGMIKVAEGKNEYTPRLDRCVAMFRLKTSDAVPVEVKRFYIELSGGCVDFNPATGYGVTQTKQYVTLDVNTDGTYEVYTFTPEATTYLDITATAADAHGNTIAQRQFGKVRVQRGCITQYAGAFFSTEQNAVLPLYMGFTVNSEWNNTEKYGY